MTERFMMKNRPPREPGVCYSLGGRLADPNEKPQKRPFSLVERRKLEAGLSDNKDNVRTESYRTGRLIISKPGEKNPGEIYIPTEEEQAELQMKTKKFFSEETDN